MTHDSAAIAKPDLFFAITPLLLAARSGCPPQCGRRSEAANPAPIAVWGLIVAGSLLIGSIPAFLGLIFVVPVLGHATWHLYRKVVP